MYAWEQKDITNLFDPSARRKLVNQLFAKETAETILTKDFYVMEFNISCRTRNDIFVPIEVGIVKFSIKDGIKDSYHDFIDPGKVPLGYAATAKDLYLNYHGIPVHGFSVQNYNSFCEFSLGATRSDDSENYHNSIKEAIDRIDKFVKPDIVYKEAEAGKPGLDVRPVFSYSCSSYDGITQTDGCLRRLASETNNLPFYEGFQVMDIVHMLKFACRLRPENVDQPFAVYSQSFYSKLLDPPYEKCCKYHYDIGNYRCALGLAHGVAYCFMDFVCPLYPIEITPAHLPRPLVEVDEADEEW